MQITIGYVLHVAMLSIVVTEGNVFRKRPDVPEWNNLLYGYSSHRCHMIPASFHLCKNIGYDKMILPNFLQHETMAEAVSSSKDWERLTEFNCHNDTRRFLCSLYAPVCVPNDTIRKIQPCQELCFSVQKSCSPSMLQYGYRWPAILDCSKFPQKSAGLCIGGTVGKVSTDSGTKLNRSTSHKVKECKCSSMFDGDVIVDKYCTSRIALKVKISKILPLPDSKVMLKLHRKSKILKSTFADIPFLSSVEVACNCPQLRTMNVREGRWLLLGSVVEGKFILNSLTKWKKKKKTFKQTIRRLKKFEKNRCGDRFMPSDKLVTGLNIFGKKMKENKKRRQSNKKE